MKLTHQFAILVLCIGIFSTPSCAKKQLSPEASLPESPVVEASTAPEVSAPEVEAPTPGVSAEASQPQLEGVVADSNEKKAEDSFTQVHISFGYDSHDLDSQAMDILKEKQAWLAAHPDIFILIEGHCDTRGTTEYNLELGKKRAMAVRDALVALGVSDERMSWVSMGESAPVDPGQTQEAHGKNRRVQFRIKAGE